MVLNHLKIQEVIKMNKKIMIYGPCPPPIHGVSFLQQKFAEYCSQEGLDVTVVRTSPVKNDFSFGGFDIKSFVLMIKLIFITFLNVMINRKHVYYINVATKGTALYRDLLIIFIFKLFSVPVNIHIRGTELNVLSSCNKWLFRKIYRGNKLIYVSNNLACLHDWLNRGSEYSVVNNGCVDLANETKEIGVTKGSTKHLLFFSNLIKQKGILEFIDVCDHLNKLGEEFKATICGSYSNAFSQETIIAMINERSLNNIIKVHGPAYDDTKKAMFNQANVLVFPSHVESFGNVLIEAMSAGLYVVSSNTTSAKFILDNGNCGKVFEHFVPEVIANHIFNLDQYMIYKYSLNARERYLELFTLEQFNKGLFNVLGLEGKCK